MAFFFVMGFPTVVMNHHCHAVLVIDLPEGVQLYLRTSGSVGNQDTFKQCPEEGEPKQSSQRSLQQTVKTKQHKNALRYRFQIKAKYYRNHTVL